MDNEGIQAESASACPLCGRDGHVLHDQLRDRVFSAPGRWTHRSCEVMRSHLARSATKRCLTSLISTRPTSLTSAPGAIDHGLSRIGRSWLSAYGYRSLSPRFGWAVRLIPGLQDIGAGEFYWLPAVPDGRLLDVGCGSGLFLARMRALGWQVCGVEPDSEAARIGRERYGLDIRSTVEDLESEWFDAVTLHHVIEHLPDPLAVLTKVRRRLRPEGRLVVVTPNPEGLGRRIFRRNWIHWDPPRHLHVFSAESLATVARRADFHPTTIRTSARAARFAWTASRTIGSTGRADVGRIRGPLQWQSLAFQTLESILIAGWHSAGEELILTASPQGS